MTVIEKNVAQVLLWLCIFSLAVYAEFGAVFVLTSGFAAIWLNLGRNRGRRGAPSAYSVFNPGCESIDGTLTGEQVDGQIRYALFRDELRILRKSNMYCDSIPLNNQYIDRIILQARRTLTNPTTTT